MIRQLPLFHTLSAREQDLLLRLCDQRLRSGPGTELLRPGKASAPLLLIQGWAAWQCVLSDGRRQIMRLFVPGEIVGGLGLLMRAENNIVALTDVVTADVGEALLAAGAEGSPGLTGAFAAAARQTTALLRDAVLRLGSLSAYERMAHLMLELADRLEAGGVGNGRRFPMPLTQEMLSDTLGISVVHTNRVLQQLRREGLIELRAGTAVLLDREALARLARGEPLGEVTGAETHEASEPARRVAGRQAASARG